jgi:hypothetical protein
MPVGGFLLGFFHLGGGWSLADLALRAFVGLVYAVVTPIFLGFPPKNEGGVGEPFNACGYI